MNKPKAYISEGKKKEVKELTQLIKEYPIIGIVDMANMPTLQLQRMRDSLRGKVLIHMTKKPLIKIALENSGKPGIEKLIEKIRGMAAVLLTKENPFILANTLKKSKSRAPAKAGQEAPQDIIVPAGSTSFSPGPIIGELSAVGIKAGIDQGKVIIKEDSLVVKAGNKITSKVAGILTRLAIEPMEIGLNLVGVYENGFVFTRDILEVDEEAFLGKIKQCSVEAFNLAFNIAYPTKENIKLLMVKAHRDSNALADSQNILTKENIKKFLAKAEHQMENVKADIQNNN